MIIAWKPMPAPYAGNAATFVPDVDLKSAVEVLKRRERDVERYAYIMEQVWKVDVSQDEDFQRVFNASIVCAETKNGGKYTLRCSKK